jgi:histidinol phosphatase-like enzyme
MRIIWPRPESASDTAAIFIDRDGVINCRRANDYVLDWSLLVFMDGIREALRELASLGLPMILISNQSAVGRGLLKQAAADFGIDLSRSVLIGDSDANVKAAQAVGCHAVLFGPAHTAYSDSFQWMKDLPIAHTAKDLFQATVGVLRKATPRALSVDVVSPGIS